MLSVAWRKKIDISGVCSARGTHEFPTGYLAVVRNGRPNKARKKIFEPTSHPDFHHNYPQLAPIWPRN